MDTSLGSTIGLRGETLCPHPQLAREYILGGHTGDFVCLKCGQEFTPAEAAEVESGRPGPAE